MEDSAATAALVGVVMALVKLIEKGMQGRNGGSIEYRLGLLENQIQEMRVKLQDFQRAFFEFREEARIKWARQEEKDE
jgi:hypothetical protein|tara:strand:+ start:539 stop:772 length:234 start_codon:yes stop_codon:yes gene_type:complete